jgi:hypothetical protein
MSKDLTCILRFFFERRALQSRPDLFRRKMRAVLSPIKTEIEIDVQYVHCSK